MGMGQEVIDDLMFEQSVYEMKMESLFNKQCWHSDNTILKISDMGTGHLQNTINWLERNEQIPFADEFIELMQSELQKR